MDQHALWQRKISQRAAEGKGLTASQKEKYARWEQSCEPRLVFSESKQKRVVDASQIKKDKTCLAIQLHLSDDPDKLGVTTSDGSRFQLLLLKGKGSSGELPQAGLCVYIHIHDESKETCCESGS